MGAICISPRPPVLPLDLCCVVWFLDLLRNLPRFLGGSAIFKHSSVADLEGACSPPPPKIRKAYVIQRLLSSSINNFFMTCSKIFLHIVNTRWMCSLIHICIRRQQFKDYSILIGSEVPDINYFLTLNKHYFFSQFYNYVYTCYLEIIKWTKILGQENKQDWIHFWFLDETRKVKGKLKSKFDQYFE